MPEQPDEHGGHDPMRAIPRRPGGRAMKWIAVPALAVMATLLFFVAWRRDTDALADELHRRWVKPGADAVAEENWRQVGWRNEQGTANRFGFPPIAAPFVAGLDRASEDIALEPPWAYPQLVEFLAAHEGAARRGGRAR